MKTLFLSLLLGTLVAHATTPTMWLKNRNGRVPLRIDSIQAHIAITGDIAETTLTLRFRNETARIQEGEFIMPLPAGSTVSSYALEVKGQLRDGVAVEKQQARHAYETIKRQMIDPGIIEREAGNTYRTKVFPIPAKGTKLVRISYIQHLRHHQGKLHYTLPTDYPGTINSFTCTITYPPNKKTTVTSKNLDFSRALPGQLKATATNQKLPKNITLTTSLPPSNELLIEKHADAHYFHLSYTPPPIMVEKQRRHPKHINIIWDASDSRRTSNIKQELNLLDAYFKKLNLKNNTRITLQILRNTLQDAGEFTLKNGTCKKLRKTLENTFYDGSTALGEIAASQHKSPLTLIFTDLRTTEQSNTLHIHPNQTTYLFHHGATQTFSHHTHPEFGESINLTSTPLPAALRLLTHTHYRLEQTEPTIANIISTPSSIPSRSILLGNTPHLPSTPFKLTYQNANGKTITQSIPIPGTTSQARAPHTTTQTLHRLWAQEKLLQLEKEGNEKSKVIAHCQKHSLVSDYTSLIVLERFKDYLRFDIPPPEPELRTQWESQRQTTQLTKNTANRHLKKSVSRNWQKRLNWHDRTFTWTTKNLQFKCSQTHIWTDAVNSLFQKTDIDPHTLGIIEAWQQKTQQFFKDEQDIQNKKNYTLWRAQQTKLIKQWSLFEKLPVKKKPGQKLAVSIRGLVAKPATYRSDTPLTLKQSITLAGGLHPSGSLQAISLYRNANALTYNLLSKNYKDIPLLPGDMVVVETAPYDDSGYLSDPFNATPDETPSAQPAVSPQRPHVSNLPNSDDGSDSDPFGGTLGDSPHSPVRLKSHIRILPPLSEETPPEAFKKFATRLKKSNNPLTAYRSLKAGESHSDAFHLQAARILQDHNHTALAIQAISNLTESKLPTPITLRETAYLLGELKLWDKALETLETILLTQPNDLQTHIDIIRYKQRQNKTYHPTKDLQNILDHCQRQDAKYFPAHITHIRTQRNATLTEKNRTHLPHSKNLTSDIRCVIYASDPKANIHLSMHEPNDESIRLWGTSPQGGTFFSSPSIDEYMLRRAMPGNYTLKCSSTHSVILQIAFYTHWGTPQQSCTWTTVQLPPGGKHIAMATCTMSFKK